MMDWIDTSRRTARELAERVVQRFVVLGGSGVLEGFLVVLRSGHVANSSVAASAG